MLRESAYINELAARRGAASRTVLVALEARNAHSWMPPA